MSVPYKFNMTLSAKWDSIEKLYLLEDSNAIDFLNRA